MEFLTRLDLRRLFKVTDRTLRRWIAEGSIPPPAFKNRWTREQVEKFYLDISGQMRTRPK